MKRLLLLGVGSALMFTMGGVGSAQADTDGNAIHKSTAVTANGVAQSVTAGGARCAGCHRAHTAKAEYLLKQAQPGLCYTCHGGAGSYLDVVDGVDPNDGKAALRGGGFAYSLINGAAGEMTIAADGTKSSTAKAGTTALAVTSRHQIDGVTQGTMWGNGAVSDTIGVIGTPVNTATTANKAKAGDAGLYGVTLECGSCHDPHGNGNYRILKPVPSDAGTAQTIKTPATPATATRAYIPPVYCSALEASGPCQNTGSRHLGYIAGAINGVNIPDVPEGTARTYTTTDYWSVRDLQVPAVNVSTTATADMVDGYIVNVAAWCTTCHTRYLAGSGSWNTKLTDAGGKVDATFTYRHRGDAASKEGVSRPNCIQCHVSHGTSATMSVGENASYKAPDLAVPTAGSGTAGAGSAYKGLDDTIAGGTAVGTSRLLRVNDRATCKMCHNV